MAFEMFVIYLAVTFVAGVITGWLFFIAGSGSKNVTRDEVRHINQIIDKINDYPNATLSLWSEGILIDSITITEEKW